MSAIIKTKYGTYLTQEEIKYRKQLVEEWIACPITNERLTALEGEIIYHNGVDYFVSNNGIDKLVGLFGELFVSSRMITYD